MEEIRANALLLDKDREDFNYNVFNALSIINQRLGESYFTNGYNPFGENFAITNEYVEYTLNKKSICDEIENQPFLERNNKELMQVFKKAQLNLASLLAGIEMLETSKEDKPRIKDFSIFLSNEIELLNKIIPLLANKNANALLLFHELKSISPEYSKFIVQCFLDNFNRDLIIMDFIEQYNLFGRKKTSAQKAEEARIAIALLQTQEQTQAIISQQNENYKAFKEGKQPVKEEQDIKENTVKQFEILNEKSKKAQQTQEPIKHIQQTPIKPPAKPKAEKAKLQQDIEREM